MKILRKTRTVIFTILLTALTLLTTMTPVSASGKNQYLLSFLYSTESRNFGYVVSQNSGQYRLESTYSRLNTNDSLLNLTVAELTSAITVNGKMMADTSPLGNAAIVSSLSYFPFTFPEFADVDGATQDYTMAANVGSDLTKSFNTALTYILKPVSTAGREALGITKASSYFAFAAAVANSGYEVISNNITTTQNKTFLEKLHWSIRQATEVDMVSVKTIPEGLTYRDYVVIQNYNGTTYNKNAIVVPYLIPKGYAEGQQLFGQKSTAVAITDITSKLS